MSLVSQWSKYKLTKNRNLLTAEVKEFISRESISLDGEYWYMALVPNTFGTLCRLLYPKWSFLKISLTYPPYSLPTLSIYLYKLTSILQEALLKLAHECLKKYPIHFSFAPAYRCYSSSYLPYAFLCQVSVVYFIRILETDYFAAWVCVRFLVWLYVGKCSDE